MKKVSNATLKKRLKERSIHNSHGLFPKGTKIITHSSRDKWHGPHWTIHSLGMKYKNRPWYECGNIWVMINGRDHVKQALKEAQKRIEQGTSAEWVRDPFGSYVRKEDLDTALKTQLAGKYSKASPEVNIDGAKE